MIQTFSTELVGLLTLALIVLGSLASIFVVKVVIPRYEASDFYKRYGFVLEALDDVVTDIVLRIAFAPGDLSRYQAEAERTGRDVRLVAAMDLVDRFTSEHNIDLDEEFIISKIEARLASLKDDGFIPRG